MFPHWRKEENIKVFKIYHVCFMQSSIRKGERQLSLISYHKRTEKVNVSRIYNKTLPKAQPTQGRTLSSKQKLQVRAYNNPFRNFDKTM